MSRQKTDDDTNNAERTRTIRVSGTPVQVTREIYETYYAMERRLRTLEEKDARNGVIHIPDYGCLRGTYHALEDSLEEQVLRKLEYERLHESLHMLSEPEAELIRALFFYGETERSFADRKRIPRATVHNQKKRVLKKLKKIIENSCANRA